MITEKVCYHDERHKWRDDQTGWCIACLVDLYNQGEVWFLSSCIEDHRGDDKSVTPAKALAVIAKRFGCETAAEAIATLTERYGKVARRQDAGFTRHKPRGFGRGRNRRFPQKQRR